MSPTDFLVTCSMTPTPWLGYTTLSPTLKSKQGLLGWTTHGSRNELNRQDFHAIGPAALTGPSVGRYAPRPPRRSGGMADAGDSKSPDPCGRVGSTPTSGTNGPKRLQRLLMRREATGASVKRMAGERA